jgi:hypothetical protein
MAYCKQGKIKAVNPDSRKWFIKKDDFYILDPNILPQSMQKRFKRYLKKKYGW